MKTSPRQLLRRLNAKIASRIPIGVAIISFGLAGFANAQVDAQSQVNFCQQTAQDALDGCQDAAESAHTVALGKCSNISDPSREMIVGNKQQQIFRTRSKPARVDLHRVRLPAKNLVRLVTIR